MLLCFPDGLLEEELESRVSVASPRQQRSLWHRLSEDEQRVVLVQFQRLTSLQFRIQFDPQTGEFEPGTITAATR